ncbi:MAG: CehA/McbA family metallohydrolase [Myxococcota bacterium]
MRQISTFLCVACALPPLMANMAHAEWFKGNTHCHTEVSADSETPMEQLMAWYKSNGYHFVVLTDHNAYTSAEQLRALTAWDPELNQNAPIVDDGFILIPGEELTTSEHHVNGLDMPFYEPPGSTIAASFEVVWSVGALPQLNHPEWNFLEARVVAEELAELRGPMFLEVYNSHPSVVDRSGPSSEDFWDVVLSSGQRIWSVAVDDAHTLEGGHTPPGGGFIYVNAEALTPAAILSAMQAGQFYASSGATLNAVQWTSSVYEVDAPGATSIVFYGQNGAVLERIEGDFASYRVQGDELYVRARVESPEGLAWTQPLFVSERPENIIPRAQIEASVTEGDAPLRVRLDGTGSSDADGTVESWSWDFGDGTSGRGPVIVHTFEEPGRYDVELTVFDDDVDLGRDILAITVRDPDNAPMPTDTGVADEGIDGPSEPDTQESETNPTGMERDAAMDVGTSPEGVGQVASGDDGCGVVTIGPGPWRIPVGVLVLWGVMMVVVSRRRRHHE